MEITQVIVAYRNPFEMWLWESGVAYGLILMALIPFVLISFGLITGNFLKNRNKR